MYHSVIQPHVEVSQGEIEYSSVSGGTLLCGDPDTHLLRAVCNISILAVVATVIKYSHV